MSIESERSATIPGECKPPNIKVQIDCDRGLTHVLSDALQNITHASKYIVLRETIGEHGCSFWEIKLLRCCCSQNWSTLLNVFHDFAIQTKRLSECTRQMKEGSPSLALLATFRVRFNSMSPSELRILFACISTIEHTVEKLVTCKLFSSDITESMYALSAFQTSWYWESNSSESLRALVLRRGPLLLATSLIISCIVTQVITQRNKKKNSSGIFHVQQGHSRVY
jgi:hypothetical protein